MQISLILFTLPTTIHLTSHYKLITNFTKQPTMKIAILATNGFEESELIEPKAALEQAGHEVEVIAPEAGEIRAMKAKEWSTSVSVDTTLAEADPTNYDALVLPGGVINPDILRTDQTAVDFVKHFVEHDKIIAAICHGPWTLINANGVAGREMTSWPSLQKDLENAGAVWKDAEVVEHDNLITSRNPDDIPVFTETLLQRLA